MISLKKQVEFKFSIDYMKIQFSLQIFPLYNPNCIKNLLRSQKNYLIKTEAVVLLLQDNKWIQDSNLRHVFFVVNQIPV